MIKSLTKIKIQKIINELGEVEWLIIIGVLVICTIISLTFFIDPIVVEIPQEYLK